MLVKGALMYTSQWDNAFINLQLGTEIKFTAAALVKVRTLGSNKLLTRNIYTH